MAKILVADDNSNIQKMVGLALKDQGIDVVAVGNGEAAVRKISDLKPDLVLADVFMPVRNGYEVCQYVKTDPALAHIPVILLVGAFDPLDEQEAQRVGADGVLKKPFVPPDPLISMVKSALARAGVLHGEAAAAAKAAELEAAKASEFLVPRVPVPAVPREEPIAALDNESFVDEAPGRPEPVRIDSGSQPFGSLLETSKDGSEDDPAFLPSAHPDLATDRDWRDPDALEDTEEVEEEKPAAPWRRDEAETHADAEPSVASKGWRSGGFEAIQSRKTQVDTWEPAEEKPKIHEVAARTQDAPAAQKSAEETVTAMEAVSRTASHEQPSPVAVATNSAEQTQSESEKKSSGNSWFSTPTSPWDSDVQKGNRLASAWDSGVAAPVSHEATNGAGKTAEVSAASETVQAVIAEAALPSAAVEAIREEAAQVAEDATQVATLQTAEDSNFYARQEQIEAEAAGAAAARPAPSMEDLVAKVLAKLSPDVLQAVTREILKPVVEAMVKEEMKSKKS